MSLSPSPRPALLQAGAVKEVHDVISVKDDIVFKAETKTLTQADWNKVKDSKALQLTLIDRIIEECNTSKGGYKEITRDVVDVDDFQISCAPKYRPGVKKLGAATPILSPQNIVNRARFKQ